MRYLCCSLFFVVFAFCLRAQNCSLTISGQVIDEFSEAPLEFTTLLLEESGIGAIADSNGYFELTGLCAGDFHLRVSHLGCHPERIYLSLRADTSLVIGLEHHAEFLQTVTVEGSAEPESARTQNTLTEEELDRLGGKSLGEMVSSIAGVSTIKGGGGISKPVIHGLYGNRISVLNNGVVQAGQRWGNDHAPEIDPFAARHLSVVKGVDAIPYGGNSLGGAVLVEPGAIDSDPHLHGALHYNLASNGRVQTLSGRVERSSEWLDWRLSGTVKYGGDRRAPGYFLRNTGLRERNVALQLAKSVNDQWFFQLYYSYFNTDLGILRGSHIGNLTDLADAIGREEPFFTEADFSYDLEAPHQAVEHHLLKASSRYYFDTESSLQFTYAGQLNRRKEFDVRRSGRTDIPALFLLLQSHFAELKYQRSGDTHWQSGIQYRYAENDNQPETGILPLIPDYDQYNLALYSTYHWGQSAWHFEVGARYDYLHWLVKTISSDLPRRIERFTHNFHNYSLASGVRYELGDGFTTKLNVGLTKRSPEVNELYSAGLHQGVSGIEEGDPNLRTESALKMILTPSVTLGDRAFIEAGAYVQWIDNYIFLEPQPEPRLTIRGAFPVFLYRQTNATVAGFDLLFKYEPTAGLEWIGKYAIVRGTDRTNDQPLVYMPADNAYSSLSYTWNGSGILEAPRLSLAGRYVWEQTRWQPEQDFLPPPAAYFLLEASVEAKWRVGDAFLLTILQVDNLLNTTYRDYLNRLRYFADEEGRNVRFTLRWEF